MKKRRTKPRRHPRLMRGGTLPKAWGALASQILKSQLEGAAPELLAACEMFTKAAHDARDALNGAGLPCPSSIALAAEKARAAIAKATGAAT